MKSRNPDHQPHTTKAVVLRCPAEVRLLKPSAMHASLEALTEAHRKQGGDVVKLKFETRPPCELFVPGEWPHRRRPARHDG